MAQDSNAELVRRVKAGDRAAFDELVRRCHGRLYRLARRLLGNVDDAQEVVQETFLAAYEGMARFGDRAAVTTWLYAIAYNKAVDRLKQRTADAWLITGELEEAEVWRRSATVHDLTDWRADPEQNLVREQLQGILDATLAQVPAVSRAVFELRDQQGLSSREAAEALGLSEGAVRVRLHRVRQLLMAEVRRLTDPDGGER